MKTVRQIINDVSFARFINELVYEVKAHSSCKVVERGCGDDKRAEGSFMFFAIIEYTEEDDGGKN